MKEMKEMKEMKGIPVEFIENGIQAKLNEISDYRIIFYDELHTPTMAKTFELYTKDLSDDGYDLISKGITEFYPGECSNDYVNEVIKWYHSVESMLLDIRIELMHNFNIENPYTELRHRKESMKEGK